MVNEWVLRVLFVDRPKDGQLKCELAQVHYSLAKGLSDRLGK